MLLVLIVLGLCQIWQQTANAQCVRDSYTSLPSAPVFPTTLLDAPSTPALNTLITGHWSEVAKMHRPPAVTPVANPSQTNCPHLTGTLVDFHTLGYSANGNVNIPANTRVLVSSCSFASGTIYNKVTIPATSELIFGDANIHFQARAIHIQGGKLLIGSETCRLRNKVTITIHGTRPASLPADISTKGIYAVDGTIEMHGAMYFPTWTRLARTINPGDTLIFIQDMVNWQPGQTIVVTTTEIKDSRDYNRNEERVISEVYRTPYSNVAAVRVTEAFTHKHYGGRAYQAEVALLSRNILIQGDAAGSEPTDTANAVCVTLGDSTHPCNDKYLTGYGVHTRMDGSQTTGRFSGVEWFRAGQTNFLGRYALHYHQIGTNVADGQLWVKDCSVHRSFFRAYAVHGTHNVHLSQNVGYDVIGHMYFLEDGVEENNRFEYNFGAHVHWLGPTQTHDSVFGAQYAFDIDEGPNLILPSDLGASVYYITNSYNYFLGNAASGGFAGFAFVNLPTPVKLNEDYGGYGQFSPMSRPLLQFKGNTAHSTAYWNEQAGAIYIGGTLWHVTKGGTLRYNSGRKLERYTCRVDPSTTWNWCQRPDYMWMVFEDSKVFLANRGMQHWGSRAEVIRAEFHDVGMSSNVFGKVALHDLLINCRSLEHVPASLCPSGTCQRRDRVFFEYFFGFQWYDVGQNHLLTNTEFRNCNPNWQHCLYNNKCGGAATFQILTHSHRYVPENMQASRNITYTNYDPTTLVKFTVPQDQVRTVSGRLTNWIDYDGSVFPGAFTGIPLILGSAWANSWWKTHGGCLGPRNDLWICPKGQDGVASFYISYDKTLEDPATNGAICPNGEGNCPIVGKATHFGRALDDGLEIGQNPKVTGPVIKASGGWFIRFNSGSPRKLLITRGQIHPDDNLVMAFPYPAGTTFSVKAKAPNFCDWARTEEVLVRVNSLAEVRAGFGDRYFFDEANKMLYIRIVQKNDECFPTTPTIPWAKENLNNLATFTRNGITLMVMEAEQFHYEILASNCGGSGAYCAPVTPIVVPAAVATQSPVTPATFAPTPPTPAPTGRPTPPCAALWAECGNGDYTGCCQDGNVCVRIHQFYAQCQPPTAVTKAPTQQATKAPTTLPPGVTAAPIPPTKTPTAQPTTKAPSYASGECAQLWTQCAGESWTGPTCCVAGAECVFDNIWYSQCEPASATNSPVGGVVTKSPTSQVTKSPTSKAPTSKSPTAQVTKSPTSKAPTSKSPTSKAPTSKSPTTQMTKSPTSKAPTFQVTKAPSAKGTNAPTKKPTQAPTSKKPTKAPTRKPTKAPTSKKPTKAPTRKPTKAPTSKRPTKAPTTKMPTTKRPTRAPTTKKKRAGL